jgi:hypothetical protein
MDSKNQKEIFDISILPEPDDVPAAPQPIRHNRALSSIQTLKVAHQSGEQLAGSGIGSSSAPLLVRARDSSAR